MQIVVGHPVRGENFFKREKVVNKIYRHLDNGGSVYMNAPRRVGKTSIMYYLEDSPRENYHFIYVDTSKIESSEDFFMTLMQELIKSEGVKKLVKASKKVKSYWETFTEKFRTIEAFGVKVEFGETKQTSYYELFNETLKGLNTETFKIIFMIDEFPTTIENIVKKSNPQEAIMFLHRNRSIRQNLNRAVGFIYTGSIGLPQLVNKLKKSETVNDIVFVDVPPLTIDEAKNLVTLLLKKDSVILESGIMDYLVSKVEWLMPFYLQLMVDELLAIWSEDETPILKTTIDAAFDNIVSNRNYSKFASYVERLEEGLALDGEFEIAKQILCLIAEKQVLYRAEILDGHAESAKSQLKNILSALEYDGYIFEENNQYRFNSPVLRMWWQKKVC